jgi:hypothetical protein
MDEAISARVGVPHLALGLGVVVAEDPVMAARLPTFQAVDGQPRASSAAMSTTATKSSSIPPKAFGW